MLQYEDVAHTQFTSNEAPSPRPKRRNLLDAPVCCPPEGKDKDKDRDSEDERVVSMLVPPSPLQRSSLAQRGA